MRYRQEAEDQAQQRPGSGTGDRIGN
jgi:hypothetical protein